MKELRRRKARAAANTLGLAVGIAALVALVSAARGWEASTSGPLQSLGADMVFLYSAPIGPHPTGCYIALHLFTFPFNEDIVAQLQNIPGIRRVVPVMLHRMQALTFCGVNASETSMNVIQPSDVTKGRFLRPDDGYVALVDRRYAEQVNASLGSTIVYRREFTVVGIVEPSASRLLQAAIYVNLPVAQETVEAPGRVNVALIRARDPGEVAVLAKAISRMWPDSTVVTSSDLASLTTGVIRIGEQAAWTLSLAIAVVVTLVSLRSQLGSTLERTREIGILKAVGWRGTDVARQILLESTLQGLAGGLVGAGAGYALGWYALSTMASEMGPVLNLVGVDPWLLAFGVMIAVLTGLAASVYPVWKAARLSPAEALRAV